MASSSAKMDSSSTKMEECDASVIIDDLPLPKSVVDDPNLLKIRDLPLPKRLPKCVVDDLPLPNCVVDYLPLPKRLPSSLKVCDLPLPKSAVDDPNLLKIDGLRKRDSFPSVNFFFCVRKQNNQHHWYDASGSFKQFKMPDDYGRAFSSFAVDSKIYFVCDFPTPHPKGPWIDLMIKKFDTETYEWTSYPRLPIFQRPKPAMVAHDGLLYILGSSDDCGFFDQDDMYEPLATVFDTRGVSGGFEDWNTLFTDQSGCVRANAQINCAIDHNYIVAVVSSKFAYICDLNCKSVTSFWGPPIALHLPGELNPPGSRNILLLNGDIIMYVYPSLFVGSLDSLRNGHWEYTRVSGDFEDYTKSATPDGLVFLFTNGEGDFYFVWSSKSSRARLTVNRLMFRITKPNGEDSWSTSACRNLRYLLGSAADDLVDCVHMQT